MEFSSFIREQLSLEAEKYPIWGDDVLENQAKAYPVFADYNYESCIDAYVEYLETKGMKFEWLASGSFSSVFRCGNRVLKVSYDPALSIWLNICEKNKGKAFFPEIQEYEQICFLETDHGRNNVYAVWMPEYKEDIEELPRMGYYRSSFYGTDDFFQGRIPKKEFHKAVRNLKKEEQHFMYEVQKEINNSPLDLCWDLHEGNVMMDSEGFIVIIDPFYVNGTL